MKSLTAKLTQMSLTRKLLAPLGLLCALLVGLPSALALSCSTSAIRANPKGVTAGVRNYYVPAMINGAKGHGVSLSAATVKLLRMETGTNIYGVEGVTAYFRIRATSSKGRPIGFVTSDDLKEKSFSVWMVPNPKTMPNTEGSVYYCSISFNEGSLDYLVNLETGGPFQEIDIRSYYYNFELTTGRLIRVM